MSFKYPSTVYFEITGKCNMRCVYCYADRGKNIKDLTNEEIREHVIPQIATMKPIVLGIIGGEPFLRFKDLVELAPDFRQIPARDFCLSTNGMLVTEEKLREIKRLYKDFDGLLISFPIDSLDISIQKQLRPPFENSIDKALQGAKIASKLGFAVSITMVVTSLNFQEIPRVLDFVKKHQPYYYLELYPLLAAGRGTEAESLRLTNEQIQAIDAYRIKNFGNPILAWDLAPCPWTSEVWDKWKDKARGYVSRGCMAGNDLFNIDCSGDIYPCTYLPTILGNIKDNNHIFMDIWENNPIVQRLKNRDVSGICGTCEHKIVCGGCRARALMETGDMFGGVSTCQAGPNGHELKDIATKNMVHAVKKTRREYNIYRGLRKLHLL